MASSIYRWPPPQWVSLAGSVVLGPLFFALGYTANLMFGLAAAAFFVVCLTLVPLLTYTAGRFRFVAWQAAVFSLVLSVIGDDLRLHSIHGREVFSIAYVFWVLGSLLSSPLPIYFVLRPLPRPKKYVFGFVILASGAALYLGIGLVTH